MLRKKEIGSLVFSILFLALVFGFNDGKTTFFLGFWLLNFLKFLIFCTICVLLYVYAQKLIAKRHDCETEFGIWFVKRWGLKEKKKRRKIALPVGVLIALFLTLISNGIIYFTGIWENKIKIIRKRRAGRKRVHLSDWEESLISVAGPVSLILLILILSWIGKIFLINLNQFILVAFFISVFNMLPIPSLDGSKIFFGSRTIYFFSLLFIVLAYLLRLTGIISSIVLSLVIAGIIVGIYYYHWEK